MVSLSSTLLLIGLVAAQPGAKKIAVFDLVSRGVKPAVTQSADAMLRGLIQQSVHDAEVVSPGEALSCPSAVCLAQMGKAMGAAEVVSGNLSGLGRTYMLELRRIDVAQERMIRSAVRTAKGGEDALVDVMRDAVAELLTGSTESPPAPGREGAKRSDPAAQGKPPAVPRPAGSPDRCALVYTVGKWTLCVMASEVAYVWSAQGGAPAAKFVGSRKREWYMRNAGKTWKVRLSGCVHQAAFNCEVVDLGLSDEPWDPPAMELAKAGSRTANGAREKLSMGEVSFEVSEEKIKATLPDAQELSFSTQSARIGMSVNTTDKPRGRELP